MPVNGPHLDRDSLFAYTSVGTNEKIKHNSVIFIGVAKAQSLHLNHNRKTKL